MTTNPNLKLLMQKMFDDEQTIEKIAETDNIEELYQICLTIQDGYTIEEFVEFFEKLVYISQTEADAIEKLDENELKDVSGGVSKFNRITASALAATMVLTGNYYGRADDGVADNAVAEEILWREMDEEERKDEEKREEERQEIEEFMNYRSVDEEVPDSQLSFWGKAGRWLSGSLDFVWDNKGKILLASTALMALGGLLVYESRQISDNIESWQDARKLKKDADKANKEKQEQLLKLNIELQKKKAEYNRLYREAGSPNLKALSDEDKKNDNIKKLLEKQDEVDSKQADYTALSEEILLDRKREELGKDSGSSAGKTLTEGLLVTGGLVTAGEKVWEVIKDLYAKLKSGNEVVGVVVDLYNTATRFAAMYNEIMNRINLYEQTSKGRYYDYEEGAKRLEMLYDSHIHGQVGAKKQLKQFYQKFAHSLEHEKEGIATEKDLSAKILVLNGPSGTGKTYMAQLLTSCLTNIEPFYINAGDILKDVGSWGDASSMQTLFWAGGKKLSSDPGKGQTNFNSLADYISSTQGAVRVVIVDEYDKLYQLKPASQYIDPSKHPLDEMFRTILDTNSYTNPYTMQKLDLSKTIFICTSNETPASLRGDIYYDSGKLRQKLVGEPETDGTGTQTLVPHDGSFVQRIAGQVCYFDSLKAEDYERIARDALGDDPLIKNKEDLQKIGGTDKVSLKYRVDYRLGGIEIDDASYKLIAQYALCMPSGARCVVGANGNDTGSVAGNLDTALLNYCSAQAAAGHSLKNLKLKAIPYLSENSSGLPIIEFDIKPLGYVDNK